MLQCCTVVSLLAAAISRCGWPLCSVGAMVAGHVCQSKALPLLMGVPSGQVRGLSLCIVIPNQQHGKQCREPAYRDHNLTTADVVRDDDPLLAELKVNIGKGHGVAHGLGLSSRKNLRATRENPKSHLEHRVAFDIRVSDDRHGLDCARKYPPSRKRNPHYRGAARRLR